MNKKLFSDNQMSEEDMIKIVGDYYESKGNNEKPTYEEILDMGKDAFITWILMRIQEPEQEKLLKEMIEHEGKNKSFAKTFKKDDPLHYKLISDLFVKNKSEKIKDVLDSSARVAKKYGLEDTGDIVKESMMAKSIEDYFSIGLGSRE